MKKTIEDIAKEDGRYNVKALKFIYEGLGHTIRNISEVESGSDRPRHVTGAELAEGIARVAIKKWGRLAKMVLNHWSVKTTRDIGEIVYLMISNSWMRAQDADRIEDFDNVYDFEQVFEKQFRFSYE